MLQHHTVSYILNYRKWKVRKFTNMENEYLTL